MIDFIRKRTWLRRAALCVVVPPTLVLRFLEIVWEALRAAYTSAAQDIKHSLHVFPRSVRAVWADTPSPSDRAEAARQTWGD